MSTGKNIATIRILKGLKQDALARTMGWNQTAISTIEKSDKIHDGPLIKIADALENSCGCIRKRILKPDIRESS